MISRCYSEKSIARNPTYSDCFVACEMSSFKYFYGMVINMTGFSSIDEKGFHYQMDNDLLLKNNRCYSEEFICFIPSEVNNFLLKSNSIRGDLPIGVSMYEDRVRFKSQIKIGGKKIHIGLFDNEKSAFNAYKEKKEQYAKFLANKWAGKIDDRAYQALMNYKVDETD
jgi:hypothetical protein